MSGEFRLLMLAAMYENGGNTTHRFLDGHPELFVYPFESQIGTRLVNDQLSSMFPVKYRWPVFALDATPEEDYRAIIDEEGKVRARTPQVSKFRTSPFDFSDDEREPRSTADYVQEPARSRANNVAAFFRATFDAWKDSPEHGPRSGLRRLQPDHRRRRRQDPRRPAGRARVCTSSAIRGRRTRTRRSGRCRSSLERLHARLDAEPVPRAARIGSGIPERVAHRPRSRTSWPTREHARRAAASARASNGAPSLAAPALERRVARGGVSRGARSGTPTPDGQSGHGRSSSRRRARRDPRSAPGRTSRCSTTRASVLMDPSGDAPGPPDRRHGVRRSESGASAAGDGHEVHLLVRPGSTQPGGSTGSAGACASTRSRWPTPRASTAVVRRIRPDWIFHLAAYGAYSSADRRPPDGADEHPRHHQPGRRPASRPASRRSSTPGSSSEYGFKDHAPAETEWLEPNSPLRGDQGLGDAVLPAHSATPGRSGSRRCGSTRCTGRGRSRTV